jgi:hypothetical protein
VTVSSPDDATGQTVLLGDGVRLVSRLDEEPVELEPLEVSSAGRVTTLRFRVLK